MMQLPLDETIVPLILCNNIDDITWALEKMFVHHSERYNPIHYCICIKVYHLPLTHQQETKALARLEYIWEDFIRPWVEDFKIETGHQIYSEGRCGGYLYVDQVGEILEGDEDPEDLRDRLEILVKFHKDWQALLGDIKAYLNRTRLRKDDNS